MQKFLKVLTLEDRVLGEEPKTRPAIEDVVGMIEMHLGIPKHVYIDGYSFTVEMNFYYDNTNCVRYCKIMSENRLLLSNLEIRISHSGQKTFFHAGYPRPRDIPSKSMEMLITESRKRKRTTTSFLETTNKLMVLKAMAFKHVLTFYHVVKTATLFLGECKSCRQEDESIYLSLLPYISSKELFSKLEDEGPILLNELEFRKVV